jgi:hypothetical protein
LAPQRADNARHVNLTHPRAVDKSVKIWRPFATERFESPAVTTPISGAGNVDLFDNHTGDRFARLISVDGSSISVRLPLRALAADAPARVTLEDANQPGAFSPTVIGVFTR